MNPLLPSRHRASRLLLLSAILPCALVASSEVSAAIRNVKTVAELNSAVSSAVQGDEIVLQAGTYQLTQTVNLTKANLIFRGATGQREDVVLRGSGMNTRGVDEGISVSASGVTIRDLTVDDFYFNGIHTRAELDVDRCTISNVKTMNIGERHIKGSRDSNSSTKMSDDFVIEKVWMIQTKPRSGHPDTHPDYIGGIDMMAMNNLIIRDCRADGIVGSGNGGNAAIFLWQGIRNVVIERNQIVGCAKGIALGNPAPPASNLPTGAWHCDGAIIRNNMILRGTWTTGNNISLELASVKNAFVAYNTFYSALADYFRVISFSESSPGLNSAVSFKYNLIRGRVLDQTSSGWQNVGNIVDGNGTIIAPSWFVAPAAGNLHLTPAAIRALDAGLLLQGVENDFDNEKRPDGIKPDLGADELKSADIDGDTIPDRVEKSPAPFQTGIDDRVMDYDNDGASNTEEFHSQTNPTDSNSVLKLISPAVKDGIFSFALPTVDGLSYLVQVCNPNGSTGWETHQKVNGTGSPVLVAANIDAPSKWFRVQPQLRLYDAP